VRRLVLLAVIGIAALASIGVAQQTEPHKVLKIAKVGGEGGWDYIYADSALTVSSHKIPHML
jgi:hypothetical protein